MSLLTLALLGAVIGLPLGYVLQHTNLCFNSAYREVLLRRDTVLLRTILLAVLIQMVGLVVLAQIGAGGFVVRVVPFYWLAAIVGGFVFGIAMVYASGCSSTVWYRVGTGNLGALVALIGFAIGEAVVAFGPLSGVRQALQGPEVTLADGALATLPKLLGIHPALIVVPLVLAGGWWLARQRAGSYLGGWDWRWAGLALGIIGTLAWIVSWPTGWQYGVGIVGATGSYVAALFDGPAALNWGSFVVLCLPIGAFLAALQTGQLRWQVPRLRNGLRMLVSGMIMGASAAIAGGCNIGHGFSGIPTLALSSITATVFTFLGASLGNYLRFVRGQQITLPRIRPL